jgi:hypothetical protein
VPLRIGKSSYSIALNVGRTAAEISVLLEAEILLGLLKPQKEL